MWQTREGTIRAFRTEGPIPSPPAGWTWDTLMGEALDVARAAELSGEVPVGAVLVHPDGRVLARAGNHCIRQHDPSAHAEINALRMAGAALANYRVQDCVLVVTLEPCLMCAGALIHSRIAGIVYGAADPVAGVLSSCMEAFSLPFINHIPWHMGGVRACECAQMLNIFFQRKRLLQNEKKENTVD